MISCEEKGSLAEQEFKEIIDGHHGLRIVSAPGIHRQELIFFNCLQFHRVASREEDTKKHFDCVLKISKGGMERQFTVDVKSQKSDYMGKEASTNILLEVFGVNRMPGWISGGEANSIFFKYNNLFYGFQRANLKAYIARYKTMTPVYQVYGERLQDVLYTRNWPKSSVPKHDGFVYVDPERLKSVMPYFVLERC